MKVFGRRPGVARLSAAGAPDGRIRMVGIVRVEVLRQPLRGKVEGSTTQCLLDGTHDAPLDHACEDESEPVPGVGPYQFLVTAEPDGWRLPGFDDAEWPSAVEHSEAAVRPRGGYDAMAGGTGRG